MINFAFIFMSLAGVIAIFQLALALGAPLGEYTMGGKFPGKLPAKMRVAAIIQIFILLFFVLVVVIKAGIAFEELNSLGKIGIWFIVAFFGFGTFINFSSPSKKEKLVMGPANVIAFISTLMVAIL